MSDVVVDAAAELLKRRQARASLLNFTEYTLPEFQAGEHHKLICEKLEAVERGEIKRLMIFAPPRCTKSELASRRFPAWFLGRNPNKQLITATYGHEFASDFGRDVRGILQSEEYQKLFKVGLRSDSKSANRWHTTENGVYITTGVGGQLTGRGAHCFPGDTLIDTPNGKVKISDVERGMHVSTCDVNTGKIASRKVLATRCLNANRLVEIRTVSGKLVRATPDHLFYVPNMGWIKAGELQEGYKLSLFESGNEMPDMFGGVSAGFRGCKEGREERSQQYGLFPSLQRKRAETATRQTLQNLWRDVPKKQIEGRGLLFKRLRAFAENVARHSMQILQQAISPAFALYKILQCNMCQRSALAANAEQGQLELSSRTRVQETFRASKGGCKRAGWGGVFGMSGSNQPSLPSHRPRQTQQHSGKPNNSVQLLPHNTPQIKSDTVSSVKDVSCGKIKVYDIQVEETSCFFAGEILVHNCALIDDPFKNRDDADSEVYRDRVWKWYTSTLYTRLMPGGALVIINTRWHEDDLCGRLLEEMKNGGDQWDVVSLPAIENEDTPNEKALWPEWYPLDVLKQTRKVIGPRDWGALYQQNPTPAEGTLFRRDWFNRYREAPDLLNVYITSDYGVSEDGDFTEFGVWGVDTDFNVWCLDWWYGQETADVWISELLRLCKEYKPLCSFGETGVIRKAIEPFLTKRMQQDRVFFRQEWITRTSNKIAMARGFQALAASGKVYFPHTDWADRVINQLCAFPAAKHDDAVDVCALIGLALEDQHPAIAPPTKKPLERDTWGRQKRANTWRV